MQFRNDQIASLLKIRTDTPIDYGTTETSRLSALCDVVYVIFLEPRAEADTRWSTFEHCINTAVRMFQPSPVLSHCELVIPPFSTDESNKTQFATYLGKKSAWQMDRMDGFHYYLVENGSRWRAVPVLAPNAASKVREEADMELGVDYSLGRYLTSTRFGRWFSGWLNNARRAPAHCATLAARVLKNALDDVNSHMKNSAWYSPSTLYTDLCRQVKFRGRGIEEKEYLGMSNQAADAKEQLLRAPMTAESVRAIGDEGCMDAVLSLTMHACNALIVNDETTMRLTQQELATALLRWVLLREQSGAPAHGQLPPVRHQYC